MSRAHRSTLENRGASPTTVDNSATRLTRPIAFLAAEQSGALPHLRSIFDTHGLQLHNKSVGPTPIQFRADTPGSWPGFGTRYSDTLPHVSGLEAREDRPDDCLLLARGHRLVYLQLASSGLHLLSGYSWSSVLSAYRSLARALGLGCLPPTEGSKTNESATLLRVRSHRHSGADIKCIRRGS